MTQSKFSNFVKRAIFSFVFLAGYTFTIYLGPIAIMVLIIGIQVKCFSEIINIGYSFNKLPNQPGYRLFAWYLLIAGNIFFYGEIISKHFEAAMDHNVPFYFTISHHRFVAFCMYVSGIIWFLSGTVKKYRLRQYKILAWIQLIQVIIVFQSYLLLENIFSGLIWFVLSTLLVITNDICAYIFGKVIGKTPLIAVSPKKTWEGFIGGAVGTVLLGLVAAHFFCQFKHLACPIEFINTDQGMVMSSNCESLDYQFTLETYSVSFLDTFTISVDTYPFIFHSIILSLFASIIAPFGGFFASAFKRSLNVKDFADTIPGHGGFMDRFDCQYLMGAFVNVYLWTFFRRYSVDKLFQKVINMDTDEQVKFFYELKKQLESSELLT